MKTAIYTTTRKLCSQAANHKVWGGEHRENEFPQPICIADKAGMNLRNCCPPEHWKKKSLSSWIEVWGLKYMRDKLITIGGGHIKMHGLKYTLKCYIVI